MMLHGGARNTERGDEELLSKNTLINTEIAGHRYTHSMTLRLDKDTGRTEDL